MRKQMKGIVLAVSLAMSLGSTSVMADSSGSTVIERPSGPVMAADMVLVRPVMLLTTLAGSAIYAISLPVTLLGGNADEAGKKLVVSPFKATFLRCLGCTKKHLPDAEYY